MSIIKPKDYILKNGATVVIRSAMVKDASQILKLMKGVISEGPFTLMEPDEYYSTVSSESKRIKCFNSAKGKVYLVAETKKEIAGFITFDNWYTRRTKHTGLFSVFIKKKFRGLGAGKLLVKELLEWGYENPVNKKISLAVFSTNKNAIALYKKLGFRLQGKCPKDMIIDGKYVDSILMYKMTK